eukprot:SAG22_NODE_657_length_8082_cov_7.277590_5_plen_204_part_00
MLLLQLERDLLDTLNEAEGNILDDNTVIKKMEFIKKEAGDVQEKIDGSKAVQDEVDAVNDYYRDFAVALSKMYFLLEGMGSLHYLYQYSLNYFLDIFSTVLKGNPNLEGVEETDKRLGIMINDMFAKLYRSVSRTALSGLSAVLPLELCCLRQCLSLPSACLFVTGHPRAALGRQAGPGLPARPGQAPVPRRGRQRRGVRHVP